MYPVLTKAGKWQGKVFYYLLYTSFEVLTRWYKNSWQFKSFKKAIFKYFKDKYKDIGHFSNDY